MSIPENETRGVYTLKHLSSANFYIIPFLVIVIITIYRTRDGLPHGPSSWSEFQKSQPVRSELCKNAPYL